MKTAKPILFSLFFLLLFSEANGQSAKEIVKKANELLRSNSSISEATMKVIKPDWSREISMKIWSLEPDYSLVLITKPARDKGTVTLKRKKEVWNWIPAIRRVIKIPPSMMLQPWMGSDFTNDDLVRQSSVVKDYEHSIDGSENMDGYDCYRIQLIPKPEAGVVWGKIISFITKKGFMEIRADYYDEDSTLVKSMVGSNVQQMGGRTIPTHWEMIPHNKPGRKTVFDYHSIQFNVKINRNFFSQQNMKRVR